jgi:hypothetical protein
MDEPRTSTTPPSSVWLEDLRNGSAVTGVIPSGPTPLRAEQKARFPLSGDYSLGFTSAGLRPDLARILAATYMETSSWKTAQKIVVAENRLQASCRASLIRLEREFRQRLELLTPHQLAVLADGNFEEAKLLSWLATVKRYRFIFGFVREILWEKIESLDLTLRPSEYEGYWAAIAEHHHSYETRSDTSRRKVRSRLLSMLRAVGILVQGEELGTIRQPVIPATCLTAMESENPLWLRAFLAPIPEIRSKP